MELLKLHETNQAEASLSGHPLTHMHVTYSVFSLKWLGTPSQKVPIEIHLDLAVLTPSSHEPAGGDAMASTGPRLACQCQFLFQF